MALGAKLARPDAPVFCVVGDGGFAHVWSELETVRRHGLKVVMTVLNNQILAYQKHAEDVLFGAHSSAIDFTAVDHAAIARASWNAHGAIVVVPSLDGAAALIDRLAPEHLELAVADPEGLARRVRHAGAIFLGRHAPEAIGDYVAGPNHVLPTAQSARFSSGLGVLDFMKRTSLIRCDAKGLAAIGPAAVTLARAEGLDAHALSVALRLKG